MEPETRRQNVTNGCMVIEVEPETGRRNVINEYMVFYAKGGRRLEAFPLIFWDGGPLDNLVMLMAYKYRVNPWEIYHVLEEQDMNDGEVMDPWP